MRARQRHFNPRDAGAIACYDSRYLYGLNNSDPVNTWPDRTRSVNNATQTGADRPTYQASFINGLPAVDFRVNKRMDITSITNPASSTVLSVMHRVNSGDTCVTFGKPGTNLYPFLWYSDNAVYERYNTGTFRVVATGQNQTGNFIHASVKNGTTSLQHYRNGNTLGSQGTPPASNSDFTRIGLLIDGGGINASDQLSGNYTFISIATSSSLRRRLEHAAAYSFKIACS